MTADPQVGHEMMPGRRGFEDVREHDAHLARAWDRRVSEHDDVWVLGDGAMGGWRTSILWFADRPGRKRLVLGNHDRPHPMNKGSHNHLRAYLDVFDAVVLAERLTWRGTPILLSHFPYDGEGATRLDRPDRATQWRLRDEGVTLAHGHTHDDVRFRLSAKGTPMHHAGVDAWGLAPVTIHDLMQETS